MGHTETQVRVQVRIEQSQRGCTRSGAHESVAASSVLSGVAQKHADHVSRRAALLLEAHANREHHPCERVVRGTLTQATCDDADADSTR